MEAWFDTPKEPGYLEIDLVHHSGASGKGEFNDSPCVESKNRSMVRSHTGWIRYDREEEYEILKRLERLTEELSIAYEKKLRRFKYA